MPAGITNSIGFVGSHARAGSAANAAAANVIETPEFKDYMVKGALKPAFAAGPEYVKWVEENEKLHRDLMTKGGLIKK